MRNACVLGLVALVTDAHLIDTPVDAGFELIVETADKEYDWTCEDAPGLPGWMSGSVIMPTAARFEYGGRKFQSILDSYGKLTQIQFSNGQVCMRAKMLGSKFFNDSIKEETIARGLLFDETIPPRPPCRLGPLCDLEGGNDNVFVKVYDMGGRFVSFTDSPMALEIDPETLSVIGKATWKDDFKPLAAHMALVGAAHLQPDPTTGNLIGVQQEANFVDGRGTVDVYEVPQKPSLERKLIKRYTTEKMRYFHAFGATTNYLILPHQPYSFDVLGSVMAGKTMKSAFHFEDGNMEFHIIDRRNPAEDPTVFKVDKFYFQHVANAFENETGVTIDISAFYEFALEGPMASIEATRNKTARDTGTPGSRVCRYHFHLAGDMKGKWTRHDLSDLRTKTEFMRINENFKGKPYSFYYANEWHHDGNVALGAMAVVKQDVNSGERIYWRPENGQFPSEPVFVPRQIGADSSPVEDDGAVLFTVIDGPSKEAYIYVVEPKTMAVLSKVKLPNVLSYTTHPTWFAGLVTKKAGKDVSESSIVV